MGQVQIRRADSADWKAIADNNAAMAQETEDKKLDRRTLDAGVHELLGPRKK